MTTKLWSDYQPDTQLLRDRVILVTGAGDGIGRAAALAFARYGASVVLLGRTIPKLEQVYDAIEQAGAPQAAIYPMNLAGATFKDYDDLALRLQEEYGRLDGLLHNAAILGTLTPLDLYEPELWYQVIQVNLHAPFLLTRACLGLLRLAPDASLLFTSASTGRHGRAYWGAYAVSQFGIEGMMQVLADELEGTRIRVNSLDPGPVRTAMRATAYPGEDPSKLPAPEDVLLPYLYLMGPDGATTRGQALSAQ